MLAIDESDKTIKAIGTGTNATFINNWRGIKHYDHTVPVVFRGIIKRELFRACVKQNRDYFYIDTGYIGNLGKQKFWHRMVKNGLQHLEPRYDMPDDRFNEIIKYLSRQTISSNVPNFMKFLGWRPEGRAILLVTPSAKPCKFYGVDRDEWVENTIKELRKHTAREIIVRDKAERRSDRVRENSIFYQFIEDDIYSVVTYNSIAAVEAVSFGIPAFTLAPNAAEPLCRTDLSQIENPLRVDDEEVIKWQHWLAYGQYSLAELRNGTAMRLIEEYDLK